MRDQIEQRLAELKTEFDAGQKMLAELDQKRASLEQTLLRISGAIQVLDELLDPSPGAQADRNRSASSSAPPVPAFPDNGRP